MVETDHLLRHVAFRCGIFGARRQRQRHRTDQRGGRKTRHRLFDERADLQAIVPLIPINDRLSGASTVHPILRLALPIAMPCFYAPARHVKLIPGIGKNRRLEILCCSAAWSIGLHYGLDRTNRDGLGASLSMYRAVTRKVQVTVTPRFLTERSSLANGYFFWAYTIDIANLGTETVQLKTRHWRITDALGRLQEVKGPGVVGEEPVLKPGESFEYTSGVPLPTPSGFMTGSYGMLTSAGEHFDIEVPAFSLDSSHAERTIN